ncbi:MAG: laccase domain-containing protein [Myxococcales bacterium]|nr:laccase domain-containing protein [Myxococcales bacterium]
MIERAPGLPAGLVHGFSDRLGGVSEGRYATLNLGRRWGDAPAAVAENYRRVAAAGGFRGETLRLVRQVHGAVVLRARDVAADSEADGLWVHRDDGPLVAGVLTADCVPLLICDTAGTVAAAVHSGWKGTVADIAGAAVRVLAEQVPVHTLVAAIGPCIEVGAFEVGEEVAAQFDPAFVRRGLARPHVDLVATVTAQLVAAGVPAAAISRVGGCTCSEPGRYFSYRRDGAGIGQMLAFIGFA